MALVWVDFQYITAHAPKKHPSFIRGALKAIGMAVLLDLMLLPDSAWPSIGSQARCYGHPCSSQYDYILVFLKLDTHILNSGNARNRNVNTEVPPQGREPGPVPGPAFCPSRLRIVSRCQRRNEFPFVNIRAVADSCSQDTISQGAGWVPSTHCGEAAVPFLGTCVESAFVAA